MFRSLDGSMYHEISRPTALHYITFNLIGWIHAALVVEATRANEELPGAMESLFWVSLLEIQLQPRLPFQAPFFESTPGHRFAFLGSLKVFFRFILFYYFTTRGHNCPFLTQLTHSFPLILHTVVVNIPRFIACPFLSLILLFYSNCCVASLAFHFLLLIFQLCNIVTTPCSCAVVFLYLMQKHILPLLVR